jgi:metal-sulfur cluster biosynthetic enzyme
MSELPAWARDALAQVHDPCCRERGLSVVDMGLVRSVRVEDGRARVELLLTTGWCPFAATVLTEVKDRIAAQPGVTGAEVEIVWDEPWTTDRLSPRARAALRFLPPPGDVPDRGEYVAAHRPVEPAVKE